jgi:hypothetical protein
MIVFSAEKQNGILSSMSANELTQEIRLAVARFPNEEKKLLWFPQKLPKLSLSVFAGDVEFVTIPVRKVGRYSGILFLARGKECSPWIRKGR